MSKTPDIFCAIDAGNFEDAAAMLKILSGVKLHYKLGLEFFVAEGPSGVQKFRALMPEGSKLFLDLKFHDIPNTVAGAVRSAVKCRADYLTIHSTGGSEMMRAGVEAALDEAVRHDFPPPMLIAVTVLTNLQDQDLTDIGFAEAGEQVLKLARLAHSCGVNGAVCSAHEIRTLKKELGKDFRLMVPGIRLEGAKRDDQKRTLTPVEAASAGADYLVIGRPITRMPDPAKAAQSILDSMVAH